MTVGQEFRLAEWLSRTTARLRAAAAAGQLRDANRRLRAEVQTYMARYAEAREELELAKSRRMDAERAVDVLRASLDDERRAADEKVDHVRAQCDSFTAGILHQRDRAEGHANRLRFTVDALELELSEVRDQNERLKAAIDAERSSEKVEADHAD